MRSGYSCYDCSIHPSIHFNGMEYAYVTEVRTNTFLLYAHIWSRIKRKLLGISKRKSQWIFLLSAISLFHLLFCNTNFWLVNDFPSHFFFISIFWMLWKFDLYSIAMFSSRGEEQLACICEVRHIRAHRTPLQQPWIWELMLVILTQCIASQRCRCYFLLSPWWCCCCCCFVDSSMHTWRTWLLVLSANDVYDYTMHTI